jgi:hypothetical protein
MKINNLNLCYCLNAFNLPTLENEKKFSKIHNCFNKVRNSINFNECFALGLWTNAKFIDQCKYHGFLDYIKKFLKEYNYSVFTLNAFPYGEFHNIKVKEKVYRPDWRDQKRLDFTCNSADILNELLPLGVQGSISSVPGAYKYDLKNLPIDNLLIAKHLIKTAEYFSRIYENTGKKIILALEMEPDCLWESPVEFVEFYQKYLSENKYATEYIGVCYDTSHQELIHRLNPGSGLQFFIDNNIKIAKIQLSAALKTKQATILDFQDLKSFDEYVYLHQTRLFSSTGNIMKSFRDIPETFNGATDGFLSSHFHIPVFIEDISDRLLPAKSELKAVLNLLKKTPKICSNIEIETYTYNVLPQILNKQTLIENITEEYKWIIKSLT